MSAIVEFTITIGDGPTVSAEYVPPNRAKEEIAPTPLKISPVRRRTVQFLITLLRDGRLTEEKLEHQVLGSNLFQTLFCGEDGETLNPIGQKLMEAMNETAADSLLRVTLKLQEQRPDLSTWPWEYLYKPELATDRSRYFLAHRSRLALTRYLALTSVRPANGARPPLKVLLVAPSSLELPVEPSSVLEELEALDEDRNVELKLRSLPAPDVIFGDNANWKVTAADFQAVVTNFDPHVIHFVGHGKQEDVGDIAVGQLAFTDDEGDRAVWLADEHLANLLEDSTSSLHLVFLQSCESADSTTRSLFQTVAGMAQSISSRSVAAVVAMHYRVAGHVGNALAREFYANLAEHRSVLLALNHARQSASLATDGAFGLPVLYLRDSGVIPGGDAAAPTRRERRVSTAAATLSCPWDGIVEIDEKNRCRECHRVLICPACQEPRVWQSNKCSRCEQRIYQDADEPGFVSTAGAAVRAADRVGEPGLPSGPPKPTTNGDGHP